MRSQLDIGQALDRVVVGGPKKIEEAGLVRVGLDRDYDLVSGLPFFDKLLDESAAGPEGPRPSR